MDSRTQVAIVHNYPIHYKHLLFAELERRGLSFEVLFTAAGSGDRLENRWLEGVRYRYRVGFAGAYERASRWATARFVWCSLQQIRPALLMISGYYDVAAWTAWLWGALHGRMRILWAESNLFDRPRPFYKELPKRLFVKGCVCAHVYGASSRAYVASLGMPDARIINKGAVVDVERFGKAPDGGVEKPPQKVLLYVGRFSPEKNLPFLLRAFAALPQQAGAPAMTLALVGYGPLEEQLRRLVAELGAGDRIHFWGRALQDELPRLYRRADALILPSLSETWGLVVLEGMVSGLPVLVSERCGCVADVIRPETGWAFSPTDPAGLTALLSEVASLPRATLAKMGQAAAERASEYAPENCAQVILGRVKVLLGTERAPREAAGSRG